MKSIIGVSGSLVIMMIIVMIQYHTVSDNIRNREVNRGLDCAFDYCIDMQYEEPEEFMEGFCHVLSECMITDGELDVYMYADCWEMGYVDVVVEESYEYGFFGKKGSNRWERAYKIE